jgi:carboxylesterase type B
MRLRLRWDVGRHLAHSGCSASAMSQLPLYGPIRTALTVACLLKGSTSTRSLSFPRGGTHVIGSITAFDDPLQRIRTGQTARVPILLGSMEDDGSVFTYNLSNISTYLERFGSLASSVTPDEVRALYPGLTDTQVIADAERDIVFRWYVPFFCFNRKGNN